METTDELTMKDFIIFLLKSFDASNVIESFETTANIDIYDIILNEIFPLVNFTSHTTQTAEFTKTFLENIDVYISRYNLKDLDIEFLIKAKNLPLSIRLELLKRLSLNKYEKSNKKSDEKNDEEYYNNYYNNEYYDYIKIKAAICENLKFENNDSLTKYKDRYIIVHGFRHYQRQNEAFTIEDYKKKLVKNKDQKFIFTENFFFDENTEKITEIWESNIRLIEDKTEVIFFDLNMNYNFERHYGENEEFDNEEDDDIPNRFIWDEKSYIEYFFSNSEKLLEKEQSEHLILMGNVKGLECLEKTYLINNKYLKKIEFCGLNDLQYLNIWAFISYCPSVEYINFDGLYNLIIMENDEDDWEDNMYFNYLPSLKNLDFYGLVNLISIGLQIVHNSVFVLFLL